MTQDDTGIIDRGEGCVKNYGFYLKFNEKSLKSFSQKKDIQFEVLKKIALAAFQERIGDESMEAQGPRKKWR